MSQRTIKKIQSWTLFLPEIKNLIHTKNLGDLKELLEDIYPVDLGELWFNFTDEEKLLLFKLLEPARAVELFEELDLIEKPAFRS